MGWITNASKKGIDPPVFKGLPALALARSTVGKRLIIPLRRADIELARAADLLLGVGDHLVPLCDPPDRAGEGEQRGEHLGREPDRVEDDARIEIDVGVELLLDEI